MRRHIFVFSVIVFLCTGCASTTSPSSVAQLQIKMNQLERRIAERDREIEELKFIVNNLSTQLEDDETETFSLNEPIEDLEAPSQTLRVSKKTTTQNKNNDRIIRVAISPEELQKALQSAGYYEGVIDGKIGSGSRKAIKNFQRDHNLKVDGIVGKNTWTELQNYLE